MTLDAVVSLARELAIRGYAPGGSGNVSWRDGQSLHISRSGVDLAELTTLDLVSCAVDWERRVPTSHVDGASKELPMHIAMHARSQDENGFVAHVHSPNAIAVSCLPPYSERTAIPPLTPYFVMKVDEVPLVEYAEPGSVDQAEKIYELPSGVTTFLMQNHGVSAFAATPELALDRVQEVEGTAATWLHVRGQNGWRRLATEEVEELRKRFPQR